MLSETLIYIIAGVASIAAAVVIAVLTRLTWRRKVRRYIVTLVGGRETVRSAFQAVGRVSAELARASDGELIAFATDVDSEDRRMLADIADRMSISSDELQTMALPKRLWPAANALADAAALLGAQASAVSGGQGVEVLDALGEMDLVGVVSLLEAADATLGDLRERYGASEDAVYGGGLYI